MNSPAAASTTNPNAASQPGRGATGRQDRAPDEESDVDRPHL